MSNEYKDYMIDKAQEYILETGQLNEIEYITTYDGGYIIIGYADEGVKELYYVWLDEEYGWSWKRFY